MKMEHSSNDCLHQRTQICCQIGKTGLLGKPKKFPKSFETSLLYINGWIGDLTQTQSIQSFILKIARNVSFINRRLILNFLKI